MACYVTASFAIVNGHSLLDKRRFQINSLAVKDGGVYSYE
jgi:hypothetical protein